MLQFVGSVDSYLCIKIMKEMDIQRNKIEFGDRIFARLTMGGKTICEFMINRVADMTELLGELRHSTRGLRGLAKLYIRNQSRGWSQERPLMLYSNDEVPRRKTFFSTTKTAVPTSSGMRPHAMAFPWEVH